jgi:ABC-type oligopeptide transport system ATPase subunit
MEKLLDVKDLHVSFKTYNGEVKAVRGVSFHVNKGETVAVVGESGCGKSVTSQTIMRLIPQPPGIIKEGEILFEGRDLTKLNDKEMEKVRGAEIAMIFQDPMTSQPDHDGGTANHGRVDETPESECVGSQRKSGGNVEIGRNSQPGIPDQAVSPPIFRRHAATGDDCNCTGLSAQTADCG